MQKITLELIGLCFLNLFLDVIEMIECQVCAGSIEIAEYISLQKLTVFVRSKRLIVLAKLGINVAQIAGRNGILRIALGP